MMSIVVLNNSVPYHLLEEIVDQCSRLDSEVHIVKNEHIVNAKSLLGLVTLSLHPQDIIKVHIEGTDASRAQDLLLRLLN